MNRSKLRRIISTILLSLTIFSVIPVKNIVYSQSNQAAIILDYAHLDSIFDNGSPYSGYNERELVNSITKKVGDKLIELGFKITYTRDMNQPMSINERIRFANNRNDDFYISIHANGYINPSANGVEAFCSKGGIAEEMSKNVIENISNTFNLKNRGVKESPYYDRYIKSPALILELGFGTNEKELDLLVNQQDKFADLIVEGIVNTYKTKGITPGYRDVTTLSTKVEIKQESTKKFDMKYNSELNKWEFIEINE